MRPIGCMSTTRPIKVLDPRAGSRIRWPAASKEGRIWVYLRDDRPWGGSDPPWAAITSRSIARENIPSATSPPSAVSSRPMPILLRIALQPAGSKSSMLPALMAPPASARRLVGRTSGATSIDFGSGPARRSPKRPRRIGELYDIEREITGKAAETPPCQRRRQKPQRPRRCVPGLVRGTSSLRIPGKGDLAKAMRYALNRWPAFMLFLDDGRVAIDNNAAERAIRPIAIGARTFCSQAPTLVARPSPTP